MLCLVDVLGVPMLLWKLLEEVRPGDRVVLLPRCAARRVERAQRAGDAARGRAARRLRERGLRLGRAAPASTTSTATSSTAVVAAYDAVRRRSRATSRTRDDRVRHRCCTSSTSRTSSALRDSRRSASWSASAAPTSGCPARSSGASATGDASGPSCRRCSRATARRQLLPRNTVQISLLHPQRAAGPRRAAAAARVRRRQPRSAGTPPARSKVFIGNRRDARLFATRGRLLGRKQTKLRADPGRRSRAEHGDVERPRARSSPTTCGRAGATRLDRARLAPPPQRRPHRAVGARRATRSEAHVTEHRGARGRRAAGRRPLLLRRGRVGRGRRRCSRSTR